jgi:hypothetical protein
MHFAHNRANLKKKGYQEDFKIETNNKGNKITIVIPTKT